MEYVNYRSGFTMVKFEKELFWEIVPISIRHLVLRMVVDITFFEESVTDQCLKFEKYLERYKVLHPRSRCIVDGPRNSFIAVELLERIIMLLTADLSDPFGNMEIMADISKTTLWLAGRIKEANVHHLASMKQFLVLVKKWASYCVHFVLIYNHENKCKHDMSLILIGGMARREKVVNEVRTSMPLDQRRPVHIPMDMLENPRVFHLNEESSQNSLETYDGDGQRKVRYTYHRSFEDGRLKEFVQCKRFLQMTNTGAFVMISKEICAWVYEDYRNVRMIRGSDFGVNIFSEKILFPCYVKKHTVKE